MLKQKIGFLLIPLSLFLGVGFYISILRHLPKSSQETHPPQQQFTICTIGLVQNPVSDEIIKSFKKELNKMPHVKWNISSCWAKKDFTLLHAMTDETLLKKPDLLLTLGLTATQAAIQHRKKRGSTIPHIFSGVHLGVWNEMVAEDPSLTENTTGSVGSENWGRIVQALKHTLPHLKRVIVPEPILPVGDQISFKNIEEELRMHNIDCDRVILETHGDIFTKMIPRIDHADLILLIRESLAIGGCSAFITLANRTNTPLYSSDRDTVEKGAAMGMGWDETINGEIAAEQAIKVLLDHIPISDIPRINMNDRCVSFVINRKVYSTQRTSIDPRIFFLVDRGFVERQEQL